ncbi:hypothetical protein CVCC1112_2187 [Paenarthrobacter nicotinovorans]|nr:hypothetical protein CVCC1112_2187 [Paenarthrobacter nicotinovorans]
MVRSAVRAGSRFPTAARGRLLEKLTFTPVQGGTPWLETQPTALTT